MNECAAKSTVTKKVHPGTPSLLTMRYSQPTFRRSWSRSWPRYKECTVSWKWLEI